MSEPEGTKHDKDKTRYDLLPPEALEAIAQVLTFGAKKYGDRNWEKGIEKGRLIRAALSHTLKWWSAVLSKDEAARLDDETGLSHLAHAACCVIFLLTYEIRERDEACVAQTLFAGDMMREAGIETGPKIERGFKCMHEGCDGFYVHLPVKCPRCNGSVFVEKPEEAP